MAPGSTSVAVSEVPVVFRAASWTEYRRIVSSLAASMREVLETLDDDGACRGGRGGEGSHRAVPLGRGVRASRRDAGHDRAARSCRCRRWSRDAWSSRRRTEAPATGPARHTRSSTTASTGSATGCVTRPARSGPRPAAWRPWSPAPRTVSGSRWSPGSSVKASGRTPSSVHASSGDRRAAGGCTSVVRRPGRSTGGSRRSTRTTRPVCRPVTELSSSPARTRSP